MTDRFVFPFAGPRLVTRAVNNFPLRNLIISSFQISRVTNTITSHTRCVPCPIKPINFMREKFETNFIFYLIIKNSNFPATYVYLYCRKIARKKFFTFHFSVSPKNRDISNRKIRSCSSVDESSSVLRGCYAIGDTRVSRSFPSSRSSLYIGSGRRTEPRPTDLLVRRGM